MTLQVGIMGAGAIGCYLGGKIASAGAAVVFVARGRFKEELSTHGIRVSSLDGSSARVEPSKIVVTSDPGAVSGCNVVLVAVKSADTASTGKLLAPILAPDTLVASMQNGLRNADELRAALPGQPVLGGIVGFNVVPKGEGEMRQTTSGPLVLEATDHPRLYELAGAMRKSGLSLEVVRDIKGAQWSKLLMNLNNAVSALTGAPTPTLLFEPGYRRIVRGLIVEALGVMKAAGVEPTRLSGIPPKLFPALLRLPSPILRVVSRIQLKVDPEARSSMHEDFVRGRLTEVDYLNGEIVALAKKTGVSAPLNARVVELIHEAEKKSAGPPNLSADALWRALTA